MNKNALSKISYGMYMLTSKNGDKINGQIVNSVIQATSDPAIIIVCVNNENMTHGFVRDSKVFTISTLSEDAPMNLIGNFGYKSGRDIDKFKGYNCKKGKNGVPVVLDSAVSFLECKLIEQMQELNQGPSLRICLMTGNARHAAYQKMILMQKNRTRGGLLCLLTLRTTYTGLARLTGS